jgi:group II intron reverse transcriptase/maturase
VVETDICSCFEAIPRDRLTGVLATRICDQPTLKLLRSFLNAGVMEAGLVERRATGTPQGGVISPLLANVYLHQVDVAWARQSTGVLVRYADDLVVMCATRREAENALALLRGLFRTIGLELKESKTRIVHLRAGGEGLDFLGFHHRWVRARRHRHIQFLARWPSRKAMQHARDRIREHTGRHRLADPIPMIVADVNGFLRGWVAYFRYGNSDHAFAVLRLYALDRLARFLAKRHDQRASWGRHMVFYRCSNQLGLLPLRGLVVAPRPFRAWRVGAECRR